MPRQDALFLDERAFETKTREISVDALWQRVFTVSPLVLVGSKDTDGTYDLAPSTWRCRSAGVTGTASSARHATARIGNIERHGFFTVSFPRYFQIVQASLAATRREADGTKPTLAALPTFPARTVDGVLVHGCYLFLECELDRFVDLDDASLVIGRIVAASAVEDAIRDPDRDDAELLHHLSPLAFLSPSRFAAVDDTQSFPYPASFRR